MTTIKDGTGGFGPDSFNVTDINGNEVAAKYLVDSNGNYVLGQDGTPLIVPADYDPAAIVQQFTQLGIDAYSAGENAEPVSQVVNARVTMYQELIADFRAGGADDSQRSYNGLLNAADVPEFQAAASYSFGLAAAALGITPFETELGGGLYNFAKSLNDPSIDASGWLGNNPTNLPNIEQGIAAAYSNLFSTSNGDSYVEVFNSLGQQTELDSYSSSGQLLVEYDLSPAGALADQKLFTYNASGSVTQQTTNNFANQNYEFTTSTELGGSSDSFVSVYAGSDLVYNAALLGVNTIYDLSGNGNTLTTGTSSATLVGNGSDTLTSTTSGSTLVAQGNGNTVNSALGDTVQVAGSGNNVNLSSNDTATVSGASNTITAVNGSDGVTFTIENTGGSVDQLNLSGATDVTALLGDTEAIVNLTANSTVAVESVNGGGTVNGTTGDVVTVAGNGVTLDTTGGQYALSGTGDIANASNSNISLSTDAQATITGTGDNVSAATGDVIDLSNATITLTASSDVTIEGSNDIIVGGGAGTGITVMGDNDSVDASGATVVLDANTSATIVGTDDVISEMSGDSLGAEGGGNTIDTVAGALTYITGTDGTFDTVYGSGDQFGGTTADGQMTGIVLASNSQANVVGSGDGIDESAGDSMGADGGGNTINTVAGALTYLTGTEGVFDTVDGSGDQLGGTTANGQTTGIVLDSNSQVNVAGSDDGIVEATGDSMGAQGGGNTIDTTAGDLTYITGTDGVFDTVSGSGDQLGGTTANGEMTGIVLDSNSQANVAGNDDGIVEAAGDSTGVYGGGNAIDTTAGALTVLGDTNGDADTVYASGDQFGGTTANDQGTGIYLNAGSQANVVGNDDETSGAADTSVTGDGSGNTLNGQGIADGSTGDISDTGSFSDPGDGGGGGYSGDGSYGYYGFSGSKAVVNAALGSNIGSIAQYDLSHGDKTGAAVAEAAQHQAQQAAAVTPTAGTGAAVLSGNTWAGEVITWSMASAATPGSPFSSAISSEYEADVEQAFATWAAASGITFEEVSSSVPSDIQIGFSDLGTATTGVVGYTAYQAANGQISSATIQLEDPGQDALVSGADGAQTYAGTDATFSQVLLHEIGHALGLADDSDQDSIMYYELTAANRTPDATDLTGIQALYGTGGSLEQTGLGTPTALTTTQAPAPSPSHAAVDHRLDQLIAGMASFAPQSAANSNLQHDPHEQHYAQLAASSH